MKKKGFTLIELLAVIVILAVIALIVMPVISSIVKDARYSATASGISNYISEVNNRAAVNDGIFSDYSLNLNGSSSLETGVDDAELDKIELKGKKPDYVYLDFGNSSRVKSAHFCVGGMSFDYTEEGGTTRSAGDYCSIDTTQIVEAGLYDSNNELIISWDDLVKNYGLDVSRDLTNDYNNSTLYDDPTSLYNIFETNHFTGKLVIPNSITKLGDYSLAYPLAYPITEIVFPKTLKSIGQDVISYMDNLTELILPEGLETIGDRAFFRNVNLTKVHIPSTVKSIGHKVFYASPGITTITVDPNNKVYDSRNNCNCIIDTAKNEILYSTINTVIPNTVTKIGYHAFESDTRMSIDIPNTVTEIGEGAFIFSSITSLNIPSSVTKIGEGAFTGTDLTSATIPATVTSMESGIFSGCRQLKTLILENGITEVPSSLCNDCRKLETLTLPDTITTLGQNFCMGCYKLQSFTVPPLVKEFNITALSQAKALTTLTVPSTIDLFNGTFYKQDSLTTLNIDAKEVKTFFMDHSFNADTPAVKTVTIGSNVEYIRKGAFKDDLALESVTFTDPTGWYATEDENATTGIALDLSNPATNADYFKNTYATYYLKKSN